VPIFTPFVLLFVLLIKCEITEGWQEVVYQLLKTVFHRAIHWEQSWPYAKYFWWNSRCFNNRCNSVSSFWYWDLLNRKIKLRSKRRSIKLKIKIKAVLRKTGYPNLLRSCDFLCFYLTN